MTTTNSSNTKWVQIWYSWGDQEAPLPVDDNKDPWEYLKELAINEAEISFFEHEEDGEIGLKFYPNENKIILHYPYDDEFCYYLITDEEEYTPDFD